MEDIVKRATEELRAREKAREEVLRRARNVRLLSKQAIMLIHNGALQDAKAKMEEARMLLEEVGPFLEDHAELRGFDEVHAAREEYAEAAILYRLVEAEAFPSPEEVGVPSYTYLLGLGDVIGELRRDVLDALRVGDLEAAEAALELMEHIYLILVSTEEASLLLRGLRRKLDVARGLIERTRSELTAEAGRRRLSQAVKELSEKIDEDKVRTDTQGTRDP